MRSNEAPTQSAGHVKDLATFMSTVGELRSAWSNVDPPFEQHEELWFRGEERWNDKTRLCPKIYRPLKTKETTYDLLPMDKILDIDEDIHREFMRLGATLSDWKSNEWEEAWYWYYVMQHYDAPTRLLDWTDGALIALHFALKGDGDEDVPHVYVLNSYLLDHELEVDPPDDVRKAKDQWKAYLQKNPYPGQLPEDWERVYLPINAKERRDDELDLPTTPLLDDTDHIVRRIAAQRSRFILFGSDPYWLQNRQGEPNSPVCQITIDPSKRKEMRIALRDAGITESVIFPDLAGLGREMTQAWEARRNRLTLAYNSTTA